MRNLVWTTVGIVVPLGLLLGLFPAHTAVFWMWAMSDPRSAVLVGAVYIGASIYYILALRLNDWEQTKAGVEGTFIVSAVLLAAVAIDWERVRPYHVMTLVWLTAYYVPLFLIPILFRREEDLKPAPGGDKTIGGGWRGWLIVRGALYLSLTIVGFVFAPVAAAHWPWRIDAIEVRMFLGQPATFVWASVNILRGRTLWRRHRVGFLYVAVLGLVQLLGLFLIRTPYRWESTLGVPLAVMFAEWIVTPAVMYLTHERSPRPAGQKAAKQRRVRGEAVRKAARWDPYALYGVRLIGTTYLIIGILGFLPIDVINPVRSGVTYLLRHIAVNGLHNAVHAIIGLTGVLAARRVEIARLWCRTCGVILLVLFVVGFAHAALQGFPRDQSLFGLVALNASGHTFHLATGIVLLVLGFLR
jgi:hypothetical protein